MANDLNRCEFIGNVGTVETRFTPDGKAITSLSIASNESWKGRDGKKVEKCNWIPVTMFGKLAEISQKYVKKGDKIYIAGKFTVEKYQDKNTGQDKYSTKIVVDAFNGEMQMLGSKTDRNQSGKPAQQQSQSSESIQYQNDANRAQQQPVDFNNSFDDDIPF